jgi:hypothetical protein
MKTLHSVTVVIELGVWCVAYLRRNPLPKSVP